MRCDDVGAHDVVAVNVKYDGGDARGDLRRRLWSQ